MFYVRILYMISFRFAYFLGTMVYVVVWLFLYYFRKDLRKEMLFFSFWVGFLGWFSAYFWWSIDWWHPQEILGTRAGIEDFLIGFTGGGYCRCYL